MRTEAAIALINNNMQQQQQSHHHHPPQHHQHYGNHHTMAQDHLLPEQQQHYQQFSHTTTALPASTTIPLNEDGLYTPPHLIASTECPPQYYSSGSNINRTIHCTPSTTSSISTASSSSSSSCSSNSSNDSNYPNSHTCMSKSTPSIGVNLRVTGQCSQGGRKYMEDYFSVAYQQSENAKDLEYAFIGIYDGHGGAEAAKFAKEHLMMEIINQSLFWSDNDHDVLRAIREGYIATHYAMWRDQEKWPKTANGLPSTAGTTATVAFIRREKIFIGHVGDSGIVLGYQNENENFWRAKQLTTDHKPESLEERTRIMNSGGKVVVKSGVPRVVWNRPRNASHRGPIRKKTLVDEIPFLAVARSLGDLWSYNSERNEFVVSPDPDVKVIPINPHTFRCLIFGTDGLWNVVSAQEAVNTVREKEIINERLLAQRGDSPQDGNQWTNPSKSLVEQALRTWSNKKMRADNTSVVTVILYPPGQEEYTSESHCNKTIGSITNPPSFLQPVSYGLEYTQVQAEVPAYDNATTYKEMALKYLPPEAYRNFNYYADESDTEGEENDESEEDEEEGQQMLITTKTTTSELQPNTNYNNQLSSTPWNWHTNPTNNSLTHITHEVMNAERQTDVEVDNAEDKDVCDIDEDNHVSSAANNREVCIINYPDFVHMETEETNNATDSYINTFAESYNTILTSQDDCVTTASSSCNSNSNSNSHSNFHSVTPPNMHAILQEQQLYQQQCMSEEEGYSLTKLETRREQQTSKTHETITTIPTETSTDAIQTFKIFHESPTQNIQNSQTFDLFETNATERYYHHHQQQQQQFVPQIQPKPLELQSLLQQEREEEQQVAYERLQMANNYPVEQNQQNQHQNITTYVCLQAIRHEAALTTPCISMDDDDDQPAEEVEYLEEEEEGEEEMITNETLYNIEQEKSVQIHEISSSSCGEDSRLDEFKSDVETKDNKGGKMVIKKIEIVPNVSGEYNDSEEKTGTNVIKTKRCTPLKITKQNNNCHPTSAPPSSLALTPVKSSIPHNKRTKSSYLYANVPNENLQRISNTKNNHSIYTKANVTPANRKRSICLIPSGGMTPPAATSTPIMQRQLRSTTTTPNANTPIDYGKRTLRTRNSLTKDLKAKTTLVQAALKFPLNTVTKTFLRTTASNLMVSKPMLLNEQHLSPCNRTRTLKNGNNVRTASRTGIKTGREKSVAINGSLNHSSKCSLKNSAHHLNLRSKHQTPAATDPTTTSGNMSTTTNVVNVLKNSSATSSSVVINRASLSDRRILRSTHSRSTASKGSQTPANFSKSTKSQSVGSNLAVPPPSPKLINAAAAVAAATRARSLINAKHSAATNGSRSVVDAVFGKRTNLRSNGSTHPAILPTPAVVAATNSSTSESSSTHQTQRGRIAKKLKR